MSAVLQSAGPGRASRDFKPRSRFGTVGIAVMVGLHVVLGYALLSGLARKAIVVVKKPVDATLIQEVKLPPPPPPPKPIVKQEVQVQAPPPPAYVPPPEVTPPPALEPAPTITAVQSGEPVAPPPAAPPTPAPAPYKPVSNDIAAACPKQAKPELPQRAIDEGISGVVKAEARIKNGRVVEVRIVSGPRVFHAAVRAAMSRYECQTSGDAEVVATQSFTFTVE